jgi:hypothetical protein
LLPRQETVVPCRESGLVFRDDFSTDDCGWATFDSGSERAAITNGALLLTTSTSGFMAWSNPGLALENVDFTVQSRMLSGPNDNAYGAICRYQDQDNFLLFLISADGYYAVGRYRSGSSQIEYLTGEPPHHYQRSDHINRGAATNLLRVRCVDDRLAFYVNGFLLTELVDSDPRAGDIGVASSAFESGMLLVEFDDVQVVLP